MKDTIHTRYFNEMAQGLGYPDYLTAIRELYQKGDSMAQISRKLTLDDSAVLRHLQKMGVPRRSKGGWHHNRPQIVIDYQGREWTTADLSHVLGTYREQLLHWLYAGKLSGATYAKRKREDKRA